MTDMKGVRGIIGSNQMTLLFIEDRDYNSRLMDLTEYLSGGYGKIVYVTLNRPALGITKELDKRGADTSRLHFIDMISRKLDFSGTVKNCVYVTTREFDDLGEHIEHSLRGGRKAIFLLDSFHTLMAYEEKEVVTRFVHDLISKLAKSRVRGVFPTISSDRGTTLIQDLEMFVDEVVELD